MPRGRFRGSGTAPKTADEMQNFLKDVARVDKMRGDKGAEQMSKNHRRSLMKRGK